jgi:hypothetical protein
MDDDEAEKCTDDADESKTKLNMQQQRKSFEFDNTDLSSSGLKKSFEAEVLNPNQSLNKTNELGFISDNDLNKNNLHNYELTELLSTRLCSKVVYLLVKLAWDGVTGSNENSWKVNIKNS